MLQDGKHGLGVRIERRGRRKPPRAAVARQGGHDHPPLRGESRRDEAPIGRRPAQPVDEHERRPGAADEVAQRRRMVAELPRLETGRFQFGLRQHEGIFCA